MRKIKTQFGKSVTGDFEEMTWTFEMPEDFKLAAGEFAIVPKDKYDLLITAIKGIANSMNAHPDCTEDSEFEGMVSRCKEAIEGVM